MINETAVEDFLAHHGVKGMKWGQRRAAKRSARGSDRFGNRNNQSTQRRLNRLSRVASGKASTGDIARAALLNISPAMMVKEGFSIKGGAQAQLDYGKKVQGKINSGKKNATDILLRIGGVDIRELNYSYKEGGSSRSKKGKTESFLNRNG